MRGSIHQLIRFTVRVNNRPFFRSELSALDRGSNLHPVAPRYAVKEQRKSPSFKEQDQVCRWGKKVPALTLFPKAENRHER